MNETSDHVTHLQTKQEYRIDQVTIREVVATMCSLLQNGMSGNDHSERTLLVVLRTAI